MANHFSHAALPYPIRKARFSVLVPYLDADGDPTDPTTPDSEVSKDAGAFADAAEEVTTITGTNGMGYLTLTGAEMDAALVGLAFKVASGPKATLLALSPRELPILASGTASAGAAGSLTLASSITYDLTGCFLRTTGGTGGGGTGGANNQARRITAYNAGTQVATVSPNWETTPDATTTYDILCPEGVTPGMLKALNPATAGRTLVVDSAGLADANTVKVGPSGSGTAQTAGDIPARLPAALVSGRIDASVGAVANNAITAAAIADGAIDRATFAADTGLQTARSNTAQGGAAGTVTLDASASATDDFYKGQWVYLTGGTGAGQLRLIAGYVGATKVASVAPNWATNPDNTSTFALLPAAGVDVELWKAASAPAMTGDAFARLGAPAGASVSADIATRASQASVDTIDDFLDTEIAAIKAKTDQLTFTVANKVDANPTAINGDATAAASLAKTTRAIGRGTVDSGATATSIPTSGFAPAGAAADQFKGRIITFDADTATTALRGQSTDITASTSAAAPTFTVTALTTAPASGDTFSVT